MEARWMFFGQGIGLRTRFWLAWGWEVAFFHFGMSAVIVKPVMKHLLVLFGCVHMACGPQGALQVVAWVSMLANYSLENGVAQGVVDTFSGERPCAMCLKIADTDFGGDGSSEAPSPERRVFLQSLPQEWQVMRGMHLAPPSGRALVVRVGRAVAAIDADSRGPAGPDTPPPRFA